MTSILPPKDEEVWIFPYSSKPVSGLNLRISQVFFALFSIASGTSPLYHSPLPPVVYWGACLFSTIGLIGSFTFTKTPSLPTKTLESLEENFKEEIHLLSGIDSKGNPQNCSIELLKTTIDTLWNRQKIKALNSLSECDFNAWNCYRLLALTPVQHWAKRGDLSKVQLLIENGAADQCVGKGSETSALYQAAFHGHIEIVKYLLSVGARSYVTLNAETPLHSFIPQLVYEYCNKGIFNENNKECLSILLVHFNCHAPKNLAYQLKIPIAEGENPLVYVQSYYQDFQGKQELIGCLSPYKKDKEVFLSQEISNDSLTLKELGEQK